MSSKKSVDSRDYLPSCWDDELRMQSLFSVFRKKELNPTGWQEKMDFWTRAINDYCRKQKQAVISANDIRNAFIKGNRYPNCIDEVLDHMCTQGMLENAENFSDSSGDSWINWGYNSVKKTVIWGYTFAMSFLKEQQQKMCRFINLDIVREMSESILKRHAELVQMDKTDYVVEMNEFRLQCKDICTGDNFHYAVSLLQREKKVLMFTENEKQFLKFPKDDSNSNTISEADKATIKLRQSLEVVTKQVEALEKEINQCTTEAKQLISNGSKSKAMVTLRKRKRLETELKRKAASMDNLETLLIQLQNAESGKHVLDAYNVGVAAMKSTLTGELDGSRVDTTIADIQEVSEELAEIEKLMSRGMSDEDDSNLEEELAAILSPPKVPVKTVESDDEILMRRLQALKQPSLNVSPPSESRNDRVAARQQYAAPLH